jgi:hypothetical protein
MNKASLSEKFALIHEHWRPKVVAQLPAQTRNTGNLMDETFTVPNRVMI